MNTEHHAGPPIKSQTVRRTLRVNGRSTSVRLEDGFIDALREIAARLKLPGVSALVSIIDNQRANPNLSSAIRVFVLDHYRQQAAVRSARR